MTYDDLADFIQNRMRMSHVYQPVRLTCLLTNRGRASVTDIARSILAHDESQVEYYEKVTNEMVGRVLRNHRVVSKEVRRYILGGFEQLTEEQVETLVALCRGRPGWLRGRLGQAAPFTDRRRCDPNLPTTSAAGRG